MERYSAAKRRRENKENAETMCENAETTCDVNNVETSIECLDKEDPIPYPSNSVCTHVQTDLTLKALTALETDYQQRMTEASKHHCVKGYPD